MDVFEELARQLAWVISLYIPSANVAPMNKALNDLRQQISTLQPKESEMTNPPTPDMRSIDQNDINAWADNVNAATAAISQVIAAGNLPPASESLLNTALGNLDGVAGTATPPPTPPAPAAS